MDENFFFSQSHLLKDSYFATVLMSHLHIFINRNLPWASFRNELIVNRLPVSPPQTILLTQISWSQRFLESTEFSDFVSPEIIYF